MFIFLGTVPNTPSGEGFSRQVRLGQGVPLSEAEKSRKEKEKERKRKGGGPGGT